MRRKDCFLSYLFRLLPLGKLVEWFQVNTQDHLCWGILIISPKWVQVVPWKHSCLLGSRGDCFQEPPATKIQGCSCLLYVIRRCYTWNAVGPLHLHRFNQSRSEIVFLIFLCYYNFGILLTFQIYIRSASNFIIDSDQVWSTPFS